MVVVDAKITTKRNAVIVVITAATVTVSVVVATAGAITVTLMVAAEMAEEAIATVWKEAERERDTEEAATAAALGDYDHKTFTGY